jgi:hypothetical protein
MDTTRSYTVDNLNIPGSLNDIAWQKWSDALRPSTEDTLDWMDTEWRQRFHGDEVAALDFYAIEDVDKAEAELWRLNRADAIRGVSVRVGTRDEERPDQREYNARQFWRAVEAAQAEAAVKRALEVA